MRIVQDEEVPMDEPIDIPQEQSQEQEAPLTIEQLNELGRESIELTEYESSRLSRFLHVTNLLKWTANDMNNAVHTCREDIDMLEKRLQYEKSRLDVYEANLGKIKESHDESWGQVSACFGKVALRLDREAESISSYGIYLNETGDVTHLVQPDEADEEPKT